jgi:hypothetical protein
VWHCSRRDSNPRYTVDPVDLLDPFHLIDHHVKGPLDQGHHTSWPLHLIKQSSVSDPPFPNHAVHIHFRRRSSRNANRVPEMAFLGQTLYQRLHKSQKLVTPRTLVHHAPSRRLNRPLPGLRLSERPPQPMRVFPTTKMFLDCSDHT